MKKIRIICFLLLVFLFVTPFVTACVPPWAERQSPIHFLGATWESEDGRVRFTININSGEYHYGIIKKDEALIEMVFESEIYWNGMEGCSIEDYEALEPDAYGIKHLTHAKNYELYDFIEQQGQENYFVAEVYHSTIYEEGECITFYRVDETKDIEVKEFCLADYAKQIEKHQSGKVLDRAEDIKTAVSQARIALEQEFGSVSDELEIYYDSIEGCWLVKGTHWMELFVSVPHIIFRVEGKVLAMWEE